MEERNMEKLPEQWETMTHQQKQIFFARNYLKYVREGEADGMSGHRRIYRKHIRNF